MFNTCKSQSRGRSRLSLEKYQQCKNKYTYLQNYDIKARRKADKYSNMKTEADNSYSCMVKIGDAYISIQCVDAVCMCKMGTKDIWKYNKDNSNKTKCTSAAKINHTQKRCPLPGYKDSGQLSNRDTSRL